MRTYTLKNVIYFPHINACGGVETFCYEFGLKYCPEYDVTVLYEAGDAEMIRKIASSVTRMIRYHKGDKIICDTFIFAYAHALLDDVTADRYIQTYHADFICRHLNPCFDERITHRFGVAENTSKGIRDHYEWAKDVVTMYNPYTVKKPRKVLNLISATRLTPEKGYKRMVTLSEALDAAGIPFHWDVYTDASETIKPFNKSVAILPQRLDILDFIANANYLVQLSDTEGYSYSIVEALSVGTPVICTALPVAEEQGIVNGKTGFILPFDMSDIPIDAIYKGVKPFKVAPRESRYEEVLSPGKAEYTEPDEYTVRCLRTYQDLQLNRIVKTGEVFTVDRDRANHLDELHFVEILEG